MAVTAVGTLGTGNNSTANTSFTLTTATNTLASGDYGILTVVTDNIATADGNTSTHTSVTGGTGTWSKLGEYTNTVGGAAGDGVCTSVWLFAATGSLATGSTITMNLSGNATDKAASFYKFTVGAGSELRQRGSPSNNGTDASNGFGSASFSSLALREYLFFRGLGKEANSTTALTVTSGFTAINNARSRNNASAVGVWGEFDIVTDTGITSNPTLAVSGDTAAVFATLYEAVAVSASPANAASTITGTATSLLLGAGLALGTLALSGLAPTARVEQIVSPAAATVTVSGPAPTVASAPRLVVELRQGTTLIATRTVSVDPTFTTNAFDLTAGERAAITNWANLQVRLIANGAPVRASWVELQTPSALGVSSAISPDTAALTLTGPAPAIPANTAIPTQALTLTGVAPRLATAVAPAAGTLTVSSVAPGVIVPVTGAVGAGVLTVTGPTPRLVTALTPSAGTLAVTGLTPVPQVLAITGIGSGALALTGPLPTLGTRTAVPAGSLALSGTLPGLALSTSPAPAALALTGLAVRLPEVRLVAAATLTATGAAPRLDTQVSPAAGQTTLTGRSLTLESRVIPGAGTFILAGSSNALAFDVGVSASALVVTGVAPKTATSLGVGTLAFTGLAPTLEILSRSAVALPATQRLSLLGAAPVVLRIPIRGAPYAPCVDQASVSIPAPTQDAVSVPTPTPSAVVVVTPASDPFRTCRS